MLVPRDSRPFFEPCGEPGYALCHISYWIWKTVPFLLMAIGTCGNILSMIVLSRKKLRQISTSVYLFFLACSDLTLIWTATFREVLMYVFRFDINSVSNFHCVTVFWLIYTSSSVSCWILALMTLERFLFTKVPIFAKRKMTRRNALIACIVLVVVMSVVSSHVMFGQRLYEVRTSANVTVVKCTPTSGSYAKFAAEVWPYIMFFAYNFLPMVFIFSGNMLILCSLRNRRKIRANNLNQLAGGQNEKMDKEVKATRLLFVLCFFFLLTTSPFMLFGIVYMSIYKNLDDAQFAGIQFTYVISKVLIWSNFTFNFFFYFMNGSLFKREWDRLVREVRVKLCRGLEKGRENTIEVATVTARDAVDTFDTRMQSCA